MFVMRMLELRTIRLRLVALAVGVILLDCSPRAHASPTPPPTAAAPLHAPHDATIHHSFADVSHWIDVFDDPSRDAWQKPQEVVRTLGIVSGMCVADLGAGTGYFSRYLSAAVGETGTVAAPAAVVNAILDALRPLGVAYLEMPAAPERVWRTLNLKKL